MYFLVNFSLLIPLVYYNWAKLTATNSGTTFLVFYFIVSLLTYA